MHSQAEQKSQRLYQNAPLWNLTWLHQELSYLNYTIFVLHYSIVHFYTTSSSLSACLQNLEQYPQNWFHNYE